jgi:hypothetical protein
VAAVNPVLNIALYQAIWFACVLMGTAGALGSLVPLALHLWLSRRRRADLQMMGILLVAGLVIDGSLQLSGFFRFTAAALPIPLWLAVIWLALATLPHHSLGWMKGRPLLSAALGAIGGPLAYWAGVRLDAAAFSWPLLPSLLLLAVIWAMLWPAVMFFAGKLSPASPPATPEQG